MLPLSMIVAIARNGVIGNDGGLPWPRSAEDMRHFRTVTMGHTCIVGRKTFEVLPVLGGRRLVVMSRHIDPARPARPDWAASTYMIEDAIEAARETDPEPIVIGGGEVYRAALPFVTRIYLTEIHADYNGDVRFELDRTGFVETSRRKGTPPEVSFVGLDREVAR